MRIIRTIYAFILSIHVALSLNNGLGYTPQMGYNSWYSYGSDINQTIIQQTAAKIVEFGFDKLGYEYVNIDGGWPGGRFANGTIYGKSPQFNTSLKGLADYVHSLGLKFGLYTDRGTKTCQGNPGSFGYEQIDANTYAAWEVDYLKEDSCSASSDQLVAFAEYAKMRDALIATNRPIFFSLCGWNEWYAPVGMSLGNSWRIGPDDGNWGHILVNIDIQDEYNLHLYSGPGGFNDPCLLLAHGPSHSITPTQSRAQFSMWAILASPLLISSDIRSFDTYTLETYSNKYVIAVNQDKAGIQGVRIMGNNLILKNNSIDGNGTNIWARELNDGSRAFVFLNVGNNAVDIQCDQTCFNIAGFYYGVNVKIYDLWNDNKFVGNISTGNVFTVSNVPANGGMMMYKMVPSFDQYPTDKKQDL